MRKKISTRVGMSTITNQAPVANLVTPKMTITVAVQIAPVALTTIFQRQPGSYSSIVSRPCTFSPGLSLPSFRRWITIPACEMVKLRKTPMA